MIYNIILNDKTIYMFESVNNFAMPNNTVTLPNNKTYKVQSVDSDDTITNIHVIDIEV